MFWTKCGTETPDVSPVWWKCGRLLTGVLRFLCVILVGACVCSMSQEIPSNAPRTREVHFYPMLNANQVYSPGLKVKVEEPHGIYKGWILMLRRVLSFGQAF
jgi:hypothetical protein